MTYLYGQMDDASGARVAYSKGNGVEFTTVTGLDQATVPPNAPSVELTSHAGTTTGPYTYDARDRLTPDANHTFDRAGNSTRIDGATYTYDGRSLLTSTAVGTRASSFTFDGEARQIKTAVDGGERRLRYGGPGDSTATYETDAAGTVTRSNLAGPGGLLADYTGTTPTYYLLSPRGDIAATMNPAGIIAATPTFDEFGVPALTNLANQYGFLGRHQKETDSASRLIMMGARAYDPQHGRFLQRDPVEGGCANDYTYVHGDPINTVDLDGRASCSSHQVRKNWGTIFAQVSPKGALQWGAYPNDPRNNKPGAYVFQVTVNGRARFTKFFGLVPWAKVQGYPPHGSVKAKNARAGAKIEITVGYTGLGGIAWGRLTCYMP